jgi:hypothetical protein
MRKVYSDRKMPAEWDAPESVVRRSVDPVSGMLIAEGCRASRGNPRKELFLSYAQPATTCPRGKPDREPNVFDRAYAWARSAWYSLREWVASHVGRERDERERGRDRYLGVPKLPEAQEIPAPMMDSTIILEIDTTFMPMEPESLILDTFPVDTFTVDTLPVDTLMPLPVDTLPPDTLSVPRRDEELPDSTMPDHTWREAMRPQQLLHGAGRVQMKAEGAP